mgnify:CR=1 FL=1
MGGGIDLYTYPPLGLLGTFWGLLETINSVGNTVSSLDFSENGKNQKLPKMGQKWDATEWHAHHLSRNLIAVLMMCIPVGTSKMRFFWRISFFNKN